MRRKDRERSEEFALEVMDRAPYVTLAVEEEGQPYCVPLSGARIGRVLYFHCAGEGKKLDCLRKNPRVCLSFVGHTRIPEGEFTVEYESAAAFGTAFEVKEKEEKIAALRAICERYTPGHMAAFDRTVKESLEITSVWGIRMEQMTGKQKAGKG